MHGEYKTPGGKLVVVDFETRDDTLAGVELSGDFFLYPEDAFADLTGALEGMSTELSASEIAARVRIAMPPGTELLGSSPDGIATAVRRALSGDEEERS